MEREQGENELSQSDEIRLDLLDYLMFSDFGDPKYQAFFDWSLENTLFDDLVRCKETFKKEKTLDNESDLRIYEYRIALHQHAIEQKKVSIKGYDDAYAHISLTFDTLGAVLHTEARKKFPSNEEAVDRYVNNEWDEVIVDLTNMLYKRTAKKSENSE